MLRCQSAMRMQVLSDNIQLWLVAGQAHLNTPPCDRQLLGSLTPQPYLSAVGSGLLSRVALCWCDPEQEATMYKGKAT